MSHWSFAERPVPEWTAEQEHEAWLRDDDSDYESDDGCDDESGSEPESPSLAGDDLSLVEPDRTQHNDDGDDDDDAWCFLALSRHYRYDEQPTMCVWKSRDFHADAAVQGEVVYVKVEQTRETKRPDDEPPKGVRVMLRLNSCAALRGRVPELVRWHHMQKRYRDQYYERFVTVTREVPGMSDDEVWYRVTRNESDARAFLRSLFELVDLAHDNGFIHRDIKMHNVRWDGETARLIDWELSTLQRPNGRPLTRYVGTRGFKAVEMAEGRGYDKRIDVYSLGVLCGQIATRTDHEDVTRKEVTGWKRMYTRGRMGKGNYPTPLLELFYRMTHHQPKKRPTIKEALRDKFFTAGDRESLPE